MISASYVATVYVPTAVQYYVVSDILYSTSDDIRECECVSVCTIKECE